MSTDEKKLKKKEYNARYRKKEKEIAHIIEEEEKKEEKDVKKKDIEEDVEMTEEQLNQLIEAEVNRRMVLNRTVEAKKKVLIPHKITTTENATTNWVGDAMKNTMTSLAKTTLETTVMLMVPLAVKSGISYLQGSKIFLPKPQSAQVNHVSNMQSSNPTTHSNPVSQMIYQQPIQYPSFLGS